MNTMTSISVSNDKSKMLNCVSWHQISSSLGYEEARARVKAGTIQVRKNQLTRVSTDS